MTWEKIPGPVLGSHKRSLVNNERRSLLACSLLSYSSGVADSDVPKMFAAQSVKQARWTINVGDCPKWDSTCPI